MMSPQRAPSLSNSKDWALEFPSESSTQSPPTLKRPFNRRPPFLGAAPTPSTSDAKPRLARDTKLVAASCVFGVLVGGFSTWIVMGHVFNTPTVTSATLLPTDRERVGSTLPSAASASPPE